MIFDWFKIINKTEFEATGLVSREIEVILEGVGVKTILVTVGELFSLVYEDVILSIGVTDANPFIFEGLAVYLHEATGDVYLGIETEA